MAEYALHILDLFVDLTLIILCYLLWLVVRPCLVSEQSEEPGCSGSHYTLVEDSLLFDLLPHIARVKSAVNVRPRGTEVSHELNGAAYYFLVSILDQRYLPDRIDNLKANICLVLLRQRVEVVELEGFIADVGSCQDYSRVWIDVVAPNSQYFFTFIQRLSTAFWWKVVAHLNQM